LRGYGYDGKLALFYKAEGSWAKCAKRIVESCGLKLLVFDEIGLLNQMCGSSALKHSGVPSAVNTQFMRLWDGQGIHRDLQVELCVEVILE